MRVAADVGSLELAEYQKAARLVLRHPLITASYPDKSALPLVRKWVRQLRADFGEVLGYMLLSSGDTIRLRRVQDTLDGTRPAVTRARRPFDRRRYAYLVLALSALGRSGAQIALSELADAVAADAGRIDGVGMDTGRKPDRDAFVDAVAWLEARGALRMADGSAIEWVNDPERAEALYDIDREVVGAIYAPSRVLQHLNSVTELLDGPGGGSAPAQGREARRRGNARHARRLVLEHPVVYYADVDGELRGQLRSASLAEDIERLTGLGLERRAEGVALVSAGQRFTDVAFPSAGTVAQAALLLCARIAGYLRHHSSKIERLPAATAAERLTEAARLLVAHGVPAAPVVSEKNEVLGVISHGEILRYLLPRYAGKLSGEYTAAGAKPKGKLSVLQAREVTVRDAMDRSVLCLSEDQLLADAAALMVNKKLERMPVVREGVLVGLLTREDIVRRLFGP